MSAGILQRTGRRGAAPRISTSRREPTIALINIVFLMLVFFLIAGTIAPRPDPDLTLVSLNEIDTAPPQDALVIMADGSLRHDGQTISAEAYLAMTDPLPDPVRLLPDRDAPARQLLALARQLRAGGAARLVIVTEQALP